MSVFKVGDRVRVSHDKYPGVWRVEKKNPTTMLLAQEGTNQLLRAPFDLLRDLDSDEPPLRFFKPGEVVRLTGRFDGLYAVIKDDGGDKVNVALLGGDGGRYVRSLRALVQPVDVAEVLK